MGWGRTQRRRWWGLPHLCGAILVCVCVVCGRVGRSGALVPGSGNRWCWEISSSLRSPVGPSQESLCRSVSVSSSFSLSSPFRCIFFIHLAFVPHPVAFLWIQSRGPNQLPLKVFPLVRAPILNLFSSLYFSFRIPVEHLSVLMIKKSL